VPSNTQFLITHTIALANRTHAGLPKGHEKIEAYSHRASAEKAEQWRTADHDKYIKGR
jgi:hypothetical protein